MVMIKRMLCRQKVAIKASVESWRKSPASGLLIIIIAMLKFADAEVDGQLQAAALPPRENDGVLHCVLSLTNLHKNRLQ